MKDFYNSIRKPGIFLLRQNRAHSFRYIINNDCTICVPIIHRREGLISLLSRSVPYLKLDPCFIIEVDDLCKEGSSNRRFPIVIEGFLEVLDQFAALGVVHCRAYFHES